MASRGGKRLGAGRKSAEVKLLGQQFFEGVVADEDLKKILRSHLSSEDPRISFQAACWVADHKFGKAKESVEVDGKLDLVAQVVVNV